MSELIASGFAYMGCCVNAQLTFRFKKKKYCVQKKFHRNNLPKNQSYGMIFVSSLLELGGNSKIKNENFH